MTAETEVRAYRVVMVVVSLGLLIGSASIFATSLRNSEAGRVRSEVAREVTHQNAKEGERLRADLALLSQTPSMREAFKQLDEGYRAYIPEHLRDMYVALNPHRDEGLSQLTDPRDGSLYSGAHRTHHGWLREAAKLKGYRDLLLVRKDGNVIYTVQKGASFATQVSAEDDTRPERELFQMSQKALAQRDGFQKSEPLQSPTGELLSYAATTIVDAEGAPLGTLVVTQAATTPSFGLRAEGWIASFESAFRKSATALSALIGFSILVMLGTLAYFFAQRRRPAAAAGFALIPVEPERLDLDAAGAGSRRSGTRPVLAQSGLKRKSPRDMAAGEG